MGLVASCTSIAAACAACWMVWLGDLTVLVLIQIDPFNKAMVIPINVRDGLSIPSPIQVFSILMHLTFGGVSESEVFTQILSLTYTSPIAPWMEY